MIGPGVQLENKHTCSNKVFVYISIRRYVYVYAHGRQGKGLSFCVFLSFCFSFSLAIHWCSVCTRYVCVLIFIFSTLTLPFNFFFSHIFSLVVFLLFSVCYQFAEVEAKPQAIFALTLSLSSRGCASERAFVYVVYERIVTKCV